MHQRQPRHLRSGAALASVLALVAILGLAPRAGHAQGQCPTQFQEQTSGTVADGGTICATAVGNKCTFQLDLCVNQSGASCTPKDLKMRTIHAASLCAGGIGKVKVKANGMSSACGNPASVKVKTKKHGTKEGRCRIRAKAGQSRSTITLLCEPESSPCSGTTTTTTTIPCSCNTSSFTRLSFTTGIGSGNCGTVQLSNGNVSKNLTCGGLYTGGGNNSVPLPYAVPDMGSSLTALTSASGTTLTLGNLTSTDTGSNRNCTSIGCLFGPPLPIPNPLSTPTSVCVVNTVAADASGTAECCSGASTLSLPLNSELFLDGDLFPNAPGIQVCPVCNQTCNAGTNATGPCNSDADCPGAGAGSCTGATLCHGGPNDGMACTPSDSAIGTLGDFPTTHDCPPPVANDIGSLPIAFDLTTGSLSKTGQTISGQNNVICGYCRDQTAASTGCFEGDTGAGCPANSACVGAGDPYTCCTGAGAGSCDQPGPKQCFAGSGSPTTCTDGNGSWPDCQQRNPGAFGPAGGGAHTITETGAPAGNMTDGAGHASTLVSIFCIRPTFNATVDAAGDLPGSGAVSLPGTAQLLP